jgi:flagellar biosynthesis/type III secretory pathway M-ring protein FliF/YscJ
MDQLRKVLALITSQLSKLTPTQKLLIGSVCVIALMSLFLVTQYAGQAKMVELIPAGTPEDQAKAAEYLDGAGVPYEFNSAKRVMVPTDRKFPALARLAKAQVITGQSLLGRNNLVEHQDWLKPKAVQGQMYVTALCNDLAKVIGNFPGIDGADVFISAPETAGLGSPMKRSVATVTVFPKAGAKLDQGTVDALADLVAGTTAGLDTKNVSIIDGVNRRSYRAGQENGFSANGYMEQVAIVEERVRDKIVDHLGRFIGDVVVSVNAIVDGSRTDVRTESALPKGEGTIAIPIEERSTTSSSTSGSRPAAPGLGGNVGMDIEYAGGEGGNTTDETSEIRYSAKIGSRTETRQMPRGRPTKINVAVSVPRGYVEQVLKQRGGAAAGGAAPTDAEIESEWSTRVSKGLEDMIRPLVQTADMAGTALEAGEVVVSLIPVAIASVGPGGSGNGGNGAPAGASGGMGGVTSLVSSGLFRQAVLGGLALLSIGMMFMLVRKAGRAAPMPTAEELVGIPPAIEPDSDLVGEADEGETPMMGIEIDSDQLKRQKMLQEVSELVKSNPQSAVGVFNRWLAPEQ